MNVAHVFWSLGFGGIETMLVNIANSQTAAGAEVSVVIINDAWDESLLRAFRQDVRVVLLHRRYRSKGLGFIFRLNSALRRIDPDVVHLHDPRLFGVMFSRRLRRRTCATLHDVPYGTLGVTSRIRDCLPFINFMCSGNVAYLDLVPRVFSISEAVASELHDKYGIGSVVVNNGINTAAFSKRPLGRAAQRPLRMVQVSRLVHQKKGQDLLLEAVARMNGAVCADFIGVGSSLEYLQKMAARLGVESLVRFLGKKPQAYIMENLQSYDLFVQPSRYEGFGLTVAEAMASRLPVLVSAGQGPAEVTCGDKYGWTFANGNVDDLVHTLTYINNHFQEVLFKAENARKYVIGTYDVSVTANRYLEEYKKI